MAKVSWTGEQEKAIKTRGKEILLSAGAGSGKTAVLVERITSLITDRENPVSPEELVVLTFSKAAAAEMKQRLIKRISEEEKKENSPFLRKQKRLIKYANISTVHVFCKNIISENFFHLNIPPDFRISDEKESKVIFEDSLTKVIEKNYEEGDRDFLDLVDLLSEGRDDRLVRKTLSGIYTNIRSYPFYIEWMEDRLKDFDFSNEVGKSLWGKIIFSYAENKVKYALELLTSAIALSERDETLLEKYKPTLIEDMEQAERLYEICKSLNWEKMREAVENISFGTIAAIRKCDNMSLKDAVKNLRDGAKDVIKALKETDYFCDTEVFLQDNAYTKKLIESIFKLIKDIDNVYSEEKAAEKLFDFSDLEHSALKLLVKRTENGYGRTEYAKTLSEKYKEILVDEYQDTNLIQELIFKSISDGGRKMFMVGDIKQSIYGFRQARPELFLEKKNMFGSMEDGEEQRQAKIVLSKNFRSRKEITDGINFIFNLIMSEKVGGLDYGSEDRLIYDEKGYGPAEDRGCEFVLIDLSDMGEEAFNARENEAGYIAKRINKMMEEGYRVFDKNQGMRAIKPSDIAILMRSVKGKAEVYQRELEKAGISASYSGDSQFLNSFEINAVMSLLKAIDNPLIDRELLGAVMSPIFGFTAEEMAEISDGNRDKSLYLRIFDKKDESPKCREFLEVFGVLKRCSVSMSVADLILKIYDISGFESVVRVMPGGKIRNLNLKLLVEYAERLDSGNNRGLNGFISFMNKLKESESDLPSAQTGNASEDSVQIMSIHNSKGLEFPVVFLVDTASKFNKSDLRENTALHAKLGFASKRRDTKLGVKYSTVHYDAVNIEKQRDLLSEEMRILYVALTRAREKLIITSSVPSPEKLLKKLNVPLNGINKIPEGLISSRNCFSDWILSALLHHEHGLKLCGLSELEQFDSVEEGGKFSIVIENERSKISEGKTEDVPENIISDEMLGTFNRRADFVYKYENMTKTPTKFAISSIGKKDAAGRAFEKRPAFLREKFMTGAERGNALHKFMQFADYENLRKDIAGEVERLVELEYLSEKEGQSIDIYKVSKFVESSLFGRIMAADKIYREYDFLAEVGAEVLGEYTDMVLEGCTVTVQGIADCIIIEGEKATVIDYKTDYAKSLEELAEKYRIQLELYKKLLRESIGREIEESIIYSFGLECEIKI